MAVPKRFYQQQLSKVRQHFLRCGTQGPAGNGEKQWVKGGQMILGSKGT
jgi:hypothetical protein